MYRDNETSPEQPPVGEIEAMGHRARELADRAINCREEIERRIESLQRDLKRLDELQGVPLQQHASPRAMKASVDNAEDDLVLVAHREGEVTDVRKELKSSDTFGAGRYRILQDTSVAPYVKTVKTTTESALDFTPSFKRGPRQPKTENATEPKGKKKGAK